MYGMCELSQSKKRNTDYITFAESNCSFSLPIGRDRSDIAGACDGIEYFQYFVHQAFKVESKKTLKLKYAELWEYKQ